MLGIVHVGAGNGQGAAFYAKWGVDTAILIEADESLRDSLTATVHGHDSWAIHTALVSDRSEEADFFVASNPRESGVLPPEAFAGFWRNLKTREQRRLNSTTLDSILSASSSVRQINWAIVDCLPALPVLRGAEQNLDHWDVLLARVIIDESKAPDSGATKSELDNFLFPRGYWCVAFQEELQPAMGTALYVRNWKLLYERTLGSESRFGLASRMHEDEMNVARNMQSAVATEHQAQIEQLNKTLGDRSVSFSTAKEELAARMGGLQKQLKQVSQEATESRKLLSEREHQLDEIKRTRDELFRLSEERFTQIEQLNKTLGDRADSFSTVKEELTAQIGGLERQLEQVSQEVGESRKLLNEREGQLDEITRTRDELFRLSEERFVQIEQLNKTLGEQAVSFSAMQGELATQVGGLQMKLEQLAQEANERQMLAADRLSQIENLRTSAIDLKQELLEARQAASLGLKLQTLREADLKDLQVRYEASLSIRDRQHQMLAKLGERLSVASGYFHKLAGTRVALVRDVNGLSRLNSKRQAKLVPAPDSKSSSQTKSKQQPENLPMVGRKSRRGKSVTKPRNPV
jgi:FkbM family methyltransferase